MAFTLNKIQLIGSLGKSAEHSATPSGVSVTRFSIATTESYKKNDQWENLTIWHNITAFNLSDFAKDTLKKGAKVYVEGRLTIDKYEAKDGTKREAAKIIATQIIPLSNKESNDTPEDIPETSTNEVVNDDDLPF